MKYRIIWLDDRISSSNRWTNPANGATRTMPDSASDAEVMALGFCRPGHSSRTRAACIFVVVGGEACIERMRIAVLLHELDGDFWTRDYLLTHLAKEWQRAGISVVAVFGPTRYVP